MMFLRAKLAAVNISAMLPPLSSMMAAAAIAAAAPHSAWHPPSAPDIVALTAIISPTAEAVSNALNISSSL